jgi:hypothetical protein
MSLSFQRTDRTFCSRFGSVNTYYTLTKQIATKRNKQTQQRNKNTDTMGLIEICKV